VFSSHLSCLDCGLFATYAGTSKEQLLLRQKTMNETLEEVDEFGLTDKEFNNSKEQLKGNIMLSVESTNSRMSRNGRNELLLGRRRTLDEIIEEIDCVEKTTVNKLIEQIFQPKYAQALILP